MTNSKNEHRFHFGPTAYEATKGTRRLFPIEWMIATTVIDGLVEGLIEAMYLPILLLGSVM